MDSDSMSSLVRNQLFLDPVCDGLRRALGITRQQFKIFIYLVETELREHEIAQAIGLQPKTIKFHTTRLYKNLGIRSRPGAMLMWWKVILPQLDQASTEALKGRPLPSGHSPEIELDPLC